MSTETAKNDKNVEVKLKGVRLSFAQHLFEPQEQKNQKGEITGWSRNCNFLIPKNTEEGKALAETIKDAMRKARDARWPPQGGEVKKIKRENMCLRDGDDEDWEGYAGHWYLSANRKVKNKGDKNPVRLIPPRKVKHPETGEMYFPQLTGSEGMLYSGCYVNAIVRIYAYDGSKDGYANRINASLEGVQHVRDGQAFGAKPLDAESAFDEEGDANEDAFEGGSKPAASDNDDLL